MGMVYLQPQQGRKSVNSPLQLSFFLHPQAKEAKSLVEAGPQDRRAWVPEWLDGSEPLHLPTTHLDQNMKEKQTFIVRN